MSSTVVNPGWSNVERVVPITSDEQALAVAREYATVIASGAAERDSQRRLPHDEMARFARAGLGTVLIPNSVSRRPITYRTLGEVATVIAAADSSIAQIALVHWSAGELFDYWAPDPLRSSLLQGIREGDLIGNASAEGPKGRAGTVDTTLTETVDGGFRLNGVKFYATGSLFARRLYVPAVNPHNGRSFAVIDADAAGVEIHDDWTGLGQRTTASGRVTFTDTPVDVNHVFPVNERDSLASQHYSTAVHIMQSAIEIGIGIAAVDDTVNFLRTQAHPPRGSNASAATGDPFTLRIVGELTIEMHTAQALLDRTGRLLDLAIADGSSESAAEALLAVCETKVVADRFALSASNKLFEICGTHSALDERNFDRHWRNARTHSLHDGPRWKFFTIGNGVVNRLRPDPHTLGHPFGPIYPDSVSPSLS